ncbi:hypothetical protein GCK32_016565 [Trichostrongylus colubriformis]|uniref:Uncharacterized protein n=1 Tax=Trichostrongylus colubriformis TaxID=6319 RepID=A0AAN8FNZ1_TRICO
MFRCDEVGVKGLTDVLRKKSIALREVEAASVETVKKAIMAELADELRETEADHVITTAIELCQTNLKGANYYEKLRSCFTSNLLTPHKFKRKGMASKQQLRRFLEETLGFFPRGLIGEKNSSMLVDTILDEIVSWKPTEVLEIPNTRLRTLDCDSCRALRSREIKLSREVHVIQRELLKRIAEFLTGLLLKTLL